jgi:tetratricopeptide (TPR) repeat protein
MRPVRPLGLLLFSLLVSVRTHSQVPAAPSASPPSPIAAPTVHPYEKEPYVFELIENKIRFEADGKGERDLTVRVRVQSESAVRELGLLVYPYDSAFESLNVLYARVLKPDGTTVDTPLSDVQELDSAVSREAPMYTDQREKHIAIKSLSTGDTLEYKLRWTIHDPIAPGYFWFDTSYFREGICLKQIVEFSIPRDVPVNLKYTKPQPSIHEDGKARVYTFQNSNLEKVEKSKIPAWESDFHGAAPPEVRLSSFPSWESVGAWYIALQQPKMAVTPEIRARADELTKGKATEEEKLRAIYDYVSTRFRYIGVDLGLGRYAPHSASDVLANRYGDCKDKHTLFATLLQAAGISAYPALISSKFRIDPTFPSPDLFDHVITAIPRGQSYLFLDTTPEVAPFGLLVSTLRDRQALIMPANAPAHLDLTPADPLVPNSETVHIDGSLNESGTLEAQFSLEVHGDGEVALRAAYRKTPQNSWQELTQKFAGAMGYAGEVSEVSVAQPEDTGKPFTIVFHYHRTDFPDWKNRRIVLGVPNLFMQELTEEQKKSKDNLPLGSSQDITYTSNISFPMGFTPVLPERVERENDFASFTAKYSTGPPNVVHGTLHLKTYKKEISGEQRPTFDDFGKTVREAPSRYIYVKGNFPADSGANLAAGSPPFPRPNNPDQAIAQLEQLAEASPGNDRIADMLVQAYIAEKQPDKALAFLDKTKARNPEAPPDLNYLYGKTYLAMKDSEKAFPFFQKALEGDPKPMLLNSVAWTLAEAGVHSREALDYSKRSVSGLASLTMDISPEEIESSDFQLMPSLAASWDTLGWIYFHAQDFHTAKLYLESAWQLSQYPLIGEHLVEVLQKLGESREAASICVRAIAAVPSNDSSALHGQLASEWETLKPFLKLPQGGSSVEAAFSQGSMWLSDMRTVNIPYHAKLQGNSRTAQFAISLTNGSNGNDVNFISGAEELRNATADLAAAKYPQSFPDSTPVRIVRRATLSCSVYMKQCVLILLPLSSAAFAN